MTAQPLPPTSITDHEVFGTAVGEPTTFLDIRRWDHEITYFVGRNGSGKSRAARVLANKVGSARMLSTDRLVGLMKFVSYGWGSQAKEYRGVPLDDESRPHMQAVARETGVATEELYALREQPEVWLRVAAFLRRALHRSIELRESAGFLDPFVRLGNVEYSLLRDEGHGLREIVVLLTAVYRADWSLLIIDEPELHLHPSLVRLWLSELQAECASSGRRAIVVTHEPSLLRPATVDDLASVWLFQPGERPVTLASCVDSRHAERVNASMLQNPQLVSQLVFSPRPVLLEGALDVLAVNSALRRTQPPEVIAQTDLIDCGGNGALAAWFSVARAAGLDVRAVGDLDCCLDPAVTRAIDSFPEVTERYQKELFMEPPRTSTAVRPLIDAMRLADVPTDSKSRAQWMAADLAHDGNAARRDKMLEIWRDANLWLHSQGTLEAVLGLSEAQKTREAIVQAAGLPGPIDAVAAWAAFRLDPSGDVYALLSVTVEQMAHRLLEALRLTPDARFDRPVGSSSVNDARIAEVAYIESTGKHRITVRLPLEFAGYWLEFDRSTPSSAMDLLEPE